jgi:methyl-accepting chemotaxis protein
MKKLLVNLPIAAKVLMAPLFVIVCLLIVAGVGWFGNQQAGAALHDLSQRGLPDLAALAQLKTRTAKLDAMVMRSLAYEGAGMKAKRIEALDKSIAQEFTAFAEQVGQLKAAATPDLKPRFEAIERVLVDFSRSAKDTIEMKSGGLAQAAMMMTSAEAAHGKLEKAVDELSALVVTRSSGQAEEAIQAMARADTLALTVLLCALVVSALVIWLCVRMIKEPLREAVRIAQEVASGDLRQMVDVDRSDETGQVLVAMAGLSARLNALLGGVQQAAMQIDGASAEIAAGNMDLSERTEQTAASLQRTASTVDDLFARMRRSNEAALHANDLARSTSGKARDGGTVMGEAVAAMDRINTQSKRIGEIIAVIDGLSFQTNLLALNAAVEAARAGEQGRGFAVVAQEVRALAARSAAAAKEIRGLIQTSVEQAHAGAEQVQAAGKIIHEVVSAVENVARVMEDITRETSEQASGMAQVSEVITSMDSTTQQNAALVEQAAAATKSLTTQTQGLRNSLAVFQTA